MPPRVPSGDNHQPDGQPSVYDILHEINVKLDAINDRLGKGDTKMSLLEHRVDMLEKLVFGGVAIALLAIGGGILTLVVKGGAVLS
jgi:hypothetical protein